MTPIFIGFFLAGASSLLFEVLWIRQMALALGSSPVSFALTSSVTILSLGAGVFLYPVRLAPRGKHPFRTAALTEGLFGLASLLFLHAGSARIPFLGICGFLSGTAISSVVASWERIAPARPAKKGLLFGLNFAGGGIGVFAGGYSLLPWLGLRKSAWIAFFLGIAAVLLYEAGGRRMETGRIAKAAPRPASRPVILSPSLLVGITGATGMGMELLWGRWISQLAGSSAYTYFTVLGVAVLAFGSGCMAGGAGEDIRPKGRVRIGGLFLSCAVAFPPVALASLFFLQRWGGSPFRLFAPLREEMPLPILLATILLMGPILFASGGFFSHVLRGGVTDDPPEYRSCFFANCAGALAGGLLIPFLLIPVLGMGGTLAILCAVNLIPSWSMFRRTIPSSAPGLRTISYGLAGSILIGGVFLARAHPVYFLFPETVRALGEGRGVPGRIPWTGPPGFFREGAFSTVVVGGDPGKEVLVVDGKPESNALRDRATQTMLAHLPFLVGGEEFRRVLLIGLGSGATLRGIVLHPVERVDCVEISPEVVAAAGEAYGPGTGNALRDPRVRIRTGDGRRFLRAATERYDLVVSQPSNPWVMGSSSLFTREAFLQMETALTHGGIALIWFQTYGVSASQLGLEVETLRSVFPHILSFSFSPGDLLFLCSRVPRRIDLARVRGVLERFPEIRKELAEAGLTGPAELLGAFFGYLGAGETARTGFRPLLRNTDDRPILEYAIARSIANRDPYPAYEAIRQPFESREDRIEGLPPKGSKRRGDLMIEWGESASRRGFARFSEEPFREALAELGESARIYNDLGVVSADRKEYSKAVEYFRKALAVDPWDRSARGNLAILGAKGSGDEN